MKGFSAIFRVVLAGCILCAVPGAVFSGGSSETSGGPQAKTLIKLASLAPEATPWGEALNQMAKEWSEASNGEVELRIYHNAVAGNESDVLRKLKQNQIQAAVFTSFGMNTINPQIMTLSCPFFIRDDTELDLVLEALKPELEAGINNAGFYMLAWSKAGWARFFSKTPVFVPDDIKKLKVGTSEDAPELTNAFKMMGYQMVPIGQNDVVVGLNSGRIEALYQSPVNAAGLQLFGIARYMASVNIAPIMGGIVMNQSAWAAIPERYKPELLRIIKRIEGEMDNAIQQLDADAIKAMTGYGLTINTVSAEQERLWREDVERALPSLLGTTFNAGIYEKITAIVNAHRNTQN
jgi:TRAP-type C4-dicarboxylate transport system substrate-binding protein